MSIALARYHVDMKMADIAEIRQGMAMAGRAAGARAGDWPLRIVESADVVDDRVKLEGLREIAVRRDGRSENHLLRPFDILITARAQAVKVALVPPQVTLTVASATLLVVRTFDPGAGLAHYLWYSLSSTQGRAEIAARLTATSLPTLSAKALGDVSVTVPPPADLRRLAVLIEASEASRDAAVEAARIRHDVLRDAIIAAIAAPAAGRN